MRQHDTGSQVLVEDNLFATLDTTVRALQPESRPRVLVSDPVGFIKQLPHDLVASFRSTLAEALEASLLLFVVDASDPTYEAQLEVSRSVLREIGADAVPSRLVDDGLAPDPGQSAPRSVLAPRDSRKDKLPSSISVVLSETQQERTDVTTRWGPRVAKLVKDTIENG